MVATEAVWWPIIRSVLIEEWAWDEQRLDADTPLFQESAGAWMDWVELTQLVLEGMGKVWPHGFEVGRPRSGEDLAHILHQALGDPWGDGAWQGSKI